MYIENTGLKGSTSPNSELSPEPEELTTISIPLSSNDWAKRFRPQSHPDAELTELLHRKPEERADFLRELAYRRSPVFIDESSLLSGIELARTLSETHLDQIAPVLIAQLNLRSSLLSRSPAIISVLLDFANEVFDRGDSRMQEAMVKSVLTWFSSQLVFSEAEAAVMQESASFLHSHSADGMCDYLAQELIRRARSNELSGFSHITDFLARSALGGPSQQEARKALAEIAEGKALGEREEVVVLSQSILPHIAAGTTALILAPFESIIGAKLCIGLVVGAFIIGQLFSVPMTADSLPESSVPKTMNAGERNLISLCSEMLLTISKS